ncbi:DUF2637 domain-containing protein [Streptomyces lydicus]
MTQPPRASVGHWDRAAILLLGAAGCALSYDALQQMAIAIHVRSWLTYLYPVVIDGFIAYGVRALILSRTAPLRARLYVWALFGTATAASIWANALHAIRLNQATSTAGSGLRLGDVTVGVLSTLAPLALAGAVHLYILISRHLSPEVDDLPSEASGPTLRQRLLRGRHGRAADQSAEPVRTLSGPQSKDGPQDGLSAELVRTVRSATDNQRTNTPSPADGPQTNTTDGPVRTPQPTTNNQQTNTPSPADGPQTNTGLGESPTTGSQAGPDSLAATGAANASGDRRTERSADQRPTHSSKLMATRTGHLTRSASADRSPDADRAAAPADQRTGSRDLVRTGPHSADESQRSSGWQRTATARTADADRQADGPVRAQSARRGPVRTQTSPAGTSTDDISALVPIARRAIEREGRINRTVVREGLRAHDIQVSNERMGLLLQRLRSGR